jgi:HEAT repeat protein
MDDVTLRELLLRILETYDPESDKNAIDVVSRGGQPALDILAEIACAGAGQLSRQAALLLYEYNSVYPTQSLITPMLSIVTNADPLLAGRALRILSEYAEEVWPQLLSRIDTCNILVQLKVLQLIGEVATAEAVGPLMELLMTTQSPSFRYTLIEVLGELGNENTPNLIALIAQFRDDPDHHVRSRVARALEKLAPGYQPDSPSKA